MHLVGSSLHDYIEIHGQQNINKYICSTYFLITATMVTRTRLSVTFIGCFVGGAFVCAVDTKHSV